MYRLVQFAASIALVAAVSCQPTAERGPVEAPTAGTAEVVPTEPAGDPSPSASPAAPKAQEDPDAAATPAKDGEAKLSRAAAPAGAQAVLTSAAPGKSANWPMWGGDPSRNMVSESARGIVSQWDVKTKKNIKWHQKLGSQSYGNVVVYDGVLLVGTNNEARKNKDIEGDKGVVMCFRAEDGKFLWQAVHDKLEAGRVNDWPDQGICSSPAVEGGRAYYVSNRAQIVCADLEGFADGENDGPYKSEKYTSAIDGDFIWVLDMIEELGVFPHNLATCSPLIVGDIVYVITSNGVERDHKVIPSPRAPSFMAVNKNTGELIWENNDPGEDILHGQWSAPSYFVAGGRPQVIFPGGDGWVRAYEPLQGKLLWKFDCNPKDSVWKLGGRGTRNNIISTGVCLDDHVYIAVGQDPEHGEGIGHLYAINATGEGDVTKTHATWHFGGDEDDFRRTISTVAIADGLLYASDLSGFLHCLDQETGKPYWRYDALAAVWGSPTVIDGKVFLGDEDGDVVVLKHGKKLEKIAEMNMDSSVYTTPVAIGDVLYISTRTDLYAIAKDDNP